MPLFCHDKMLLDRDSEYRIPQDGSNYADDIREKFPGSSAQDALNDQKSIEVLQKDCDTQAQTYFGGVDVAAETKKNTMPGF